MAFAYTLAEMRSVLGLEVNSVLIEEDDKNAVFRDPATNDYTLIGDAASQCAGKEAW